MLYKKNQSPTLAPELFQNPTEEYRGTPFWAWNCKVTPDLVRRQIGYLAEMGFGGYHIHSRTGMDVPYLSDEFMNLIKVCAEEAKKTHTLAWLYDEDRWPSGAAGGLVTKTPKYRQRMLRLSRNDITADIPDKEQAIELGKPYLYRVYDIVQNDAGELISYDMISPDAEAKGTKWFAYCFTASESGWYNNQTYVDTLSKEAIDKFIETTHERYKEAVGEDFDGVVPAIFTDEPQFSRKGTHSFAKATNDVTLPWTPKFDELYEARYHAKIDWAVPELFWELPEGRISQSRYYYHDFICQLFTEAFADNCGDWCEKNGISMTGHMMEEPSLHSQTAALGEAMRSYRKFQIPGIDMLCDAHEYTTAKQAQSAVHQYGREGMLSELYGVTDWDFDFRGHKHQGDWQAALGVTVRVPHLSWMSMYGNAKRDYPASIFYQSPWYKEYPYIEDHYARLNTALTRGVPMVDIGVIHPVESYWLHWGPTENTGTVRAQMEGNFRNVIDWLLFSQLDFDYISESLLPEQFGGVEDARLRVGKMAYKVILVPPMETIRKTTLDILTQFAKAGGKIIFMGDCPTLVDALTSDGARALYDASEVIGISHDALINAMNPYRRLVIRDGSGSIAGKFLYNYRRDTDCDWVFICNGKPVNRGCRGKYHNGTWIAITIEGEFTPMEYNTLTGEVSVADYTVEGGKTVIRRTHYEYDSVIYRLLPYDASVKYTRAPEMKLVRTHHCMKPVDYRLDEPNAMLIDLAKWRIDSASLTADGEWNSCEELLRVHNAAAKALGITNSSAQPWVIPEEALTHTVDLRVTFHSEIEYEGAYLAIENAPLCEVILNGVAAESGTHGYFVDESIEKLALPKIVKGENVLLIRSPIGSRTRIEWCYLLGDFGVKVAGCEKTITALPEKLGYSTVTAQNLPFYTGNIEYTEEIDTPDCQLVVRASEYRGALVKVFLDGRDMGVIAFDPMRLDLGKVSAGRHTLTYKLFGTRFNAFAALHNTNQGDKWTGPNIWYTTGDSWCYEYRLRDMGLLASPVVEMYE
ncbi:MAG: hypothetical protein E7632_00980 [Ruminococcaceae bacterium]|nr:hypothetical protein [Oscillospiraceae bacterium]